MSEHSTHFDDCGCLSARHAQQIADANAAITKLQRVIEDARRDLSLGRVWDAQQTLNRKG